MLNTASGTERLSHVPEIQKGSHRRGLVVISHEGLPDCLLFALEREFPWLTVTEVSDPESACRAMGIPVTLVLIDIALMEECAAAMPDISRYHPTAIKALMIPDDRIASRVLHAMPGIETIGGVLPLNLKLDVWLSIVCLMLRGGEYFPASLFQTIPRALPAFSTGSGQRSDRVSRDDEPTATDQGHDHYPAIASLTDREFQVLELVAHGTQNKLIANALGLSPHTVKIHIHNVIRKLGIHNRTQAAALFHRYTASDGAGHRAGAARRQRY